MRLTPQQWSCEVALHEGPIVFPNFHTPLINPPPPSIYDLSLLLSHAMATHILHSFVYIYIYAPKSVEKGKKKG
jgi:hypothetical protein